MAGAMACVGGMSVAPLLKRIRYTRPQTYLPTNKRHENVRQAFAARRMDLTGWGVWLVDDVKTTGATLTACTKTVAPGGGAAHPRCDRCGRGCSEHTFLDAMSSDRRNWVLKCPVLPPGFHLPTKLRTNLLS